MHNASFDCDRSCSLFELVDLCRFNPVLLHVGCTVVNSHVVSVDVCIRDLEALKAAADACGLEFRQDQRTYHWFGKHVGDYPLPDGFKADDLGKCSHALSLKGSVVEHCMSPYEIGIVEGTDGTFRLLWDFFGGGYGLQDCVGENCHKLIERYTIEAARNAAAMQGWYCEDNVAGGLTIYHPDGGTLSVDLDGNVEASDFQGQGCHAPTMQISEALGSVNQAQAKPAYFEQQQHVNVNVK